MLRRRKQPSLAELHLFFQQFSTLVASGIPILNCLNLLLALQHNPTLHSLIIRLQQDLLAGKRLVNSFNNTPYFDPLLRQLISIGEQSGKLEYMLIECARYLHDKIQWRNKLKQALTYPLILIIFAALILFFLFIFIVPRFALLFQDNSQVLPSLTRIIFDVANTCKNQCVWITLFFLAFVFFIIHLTQRRYFKFPYKAFPYFKKWYLIIIFSRFCRHLALLLEAGITLTFALQILAQTTSSTLLRIVIYQVQKELNAGKSLHSALALNKDIPDLMIQFIKIGEQSGTLDTMLNRLAKLWEHQLDTLLTTLIPFLEPLIMIVLGVLIGGIVFSLYLPIFKLGSIV